MGQDVIPVLIDCIATTIPHVHNSSASYGVKDSRYHLLSVTSTYSKPQVALLVSQIPQRHSPRKGYYNKRILTNSLHVHAIRSWATGARHPHRRICKSSFKWKHCPSTEGGMHLPRPEMLMRFVFEMLLIFFFFLQNESVSEKKWQCVWN